MQFRGLSVFEFAVLVLVAFGLVTGCSTRSATTLSAKIIRQDFLAKSNIDRSPLSPGLTYVRVTRAGEVAFLALGSQRIERGFKREIYYSGQRETLELIDGRIVSLYAGVEMFQWNRPSAPDWYSTELENALLPSSGAGQLSYVRSIDLQSPYRYGHQELITVRALLPSEVNPQQLKRHDRSALDWFEETMVPVQARSASWNPSNARKNLFGLDPKSRTVVYSEQCPYPAACFSIEQWQ